jgi:hypothetical protein
MTLRIAGTRMLSRTRARLQSSSYSSPVMRPEAAIVAAGSANSLPDPYAEGALSLALMLETAGELIPDLPIDEVGGLVDQLAATSPFRVED